MRVLPKSPPNPDVITVTVNQTKPKTEKKLIRVATAAVTTATNALKRCQIAAAITAS